MLNVKAAIDAEKDYTLTLTTKTSSRACRHLKLRKPGDCFAARAIRFSDPNVKDVRVHRGISYIHFHGEEAPRKFQNSPEARRLAEINDLHGKRGMLNALRIIHSLLGEQQVKFYKPRWGLSYARTRSSEFREKQKEWKAAAKARPEGEKKKKYTRPEALGLRNGAGKAHSWDDKE